MVKMLDLGFVIQKGELCVEVGVFESRFGQRNDLISFFTKFRFLRGGGF